MSFFNSIMGGIASPLMGGRGGRGDGGYGRGGYNGSYDGGANNYYNQIPQVASRYLDPYVNAGQQASASIDPLYEGMMQSSNQDVATPALYNNIQNPWTGARNPWYDQYDMYQKEAPRQFGQMANDPAAYLNQIQKSYTPSEGYKYRRKQLEAAMGAEAAAGGRRGTPFSSERQAEALNGIMGQDMQQHFGNYLDLQNQGLGGLERMLAGRERLQSERLQGGQRFAEKAYEGTQRHQEFNLAGAERDIDRKIREDERKLRRRDEILRGLISSREQRGEGGRAAAHDMASILGTNLINQATLAHGGAQQRMQQQQMDRRSQEAQKYNRQRQMVDLLGSLGGAYLGSR